MHYFIYETTNTITGIKYIGKHKTDDINDGYLGSGLILSNAIKKYGKNAFVREILFSFDSEEEMNEKERELITLDVCNSDEYYNIALGGQGGCLVLSENHPKREATIAKIKNAQLENSELLSERARRQHIEKNIGMYGKKHTDETKRKMSESGKKIDRYWVRGRIVSDETREKLRLANVGKKMSDEARRKMSENHPNAKGEKNPMYGRKHSEETRKKISEKNKANVGWKHSPETIEKIKASLRLRYDKDKV